jgi:hypothetical protein
MPPKVMQKPINSTNSQTRFVEGQDFDLLHCMEVGLKRVAVKDH